RPDRFEQDAARRNDRAVRRAQVLEPAVGHGAHAFLDRAVLRVRPADPGIGLGLLYLAVDLVAVGAVADGPEVVRYVDIHTELVAGARQRALLLRQRLV